MAPSPIIPTSFVPKQPVRAAGRFKNSGGNIFFLASVVLLAVSLFLSVGVFAYERYLSGVRDSKQQAVKDAEDAIDIAAVEEFVRTRDRFVAAERILDSHVATTQFFALLERATLVNVRFDSLSFTLAEDRTAGITMGGVARTFNALAAQSSALASEKEVKRAIFSDIDVNDNDTVSFTLTAELVPSLIVSSFEGAPETAIPAAPVSEESTLPAEEAPTETVPAETP